jgi:hypothetical protein
VIKFFEAIVEFMWFGAISAGVLYDLHYMYTYEHLGLKLLFLVLAVGTGYNGWVTAREKFVL